MASKEDMLEVNNGLTMEELDTQMQECEADCDATTWQSSIEEVFAQPDLNRTSFVWQIHLPNTEPYPEEWEAEQDDWFCLPSHWQSILNARLADFRSKVSDAEAFHRSRKDAFGDNDIKTKNALTKLKQLEQGDGSSFVVLISKATQKEASQEVYRKSMAVANGVCKVATSNKVIAYVLDVSKMTLEVHDKTVEEKETKQLRLISVTGRSREIQELRVHLNALSLQTSNLLDHVNMPKKKQVKNKKKAEGESVFEEKENEGEGRGC